MALGKPFERLRETTKTAINLRYCEAEKKLTCPVCGKGGLYLAEAQQFKHSRQVRGHNGKPGKITETVYCDIKKAAG